MSTNGDLSLRQRAIWERIAPFWAEHRHLTALPDLVWTTAPPDEPALGPGDRVLELGCGAGHRAVGLAETGATVVATDVTTAFLELAAAAGARFGDHFQTQLVDATDPDSLAAVEGRFRAVVADMVLMNLFELDPLARALGDLLEPDGWFAALVLHPCFGSPFYVDIDDRGRPTGAVGKMVGAGQRIATYLPAGVVGLSARVLRPILARPRPYGPEVARRVSVPGQPEPHFNVHRPLSALLAPFFAAGLVLDDLREAGDGREPEPGILYLRFRRRT